jgi:hypothetical protein
MLFRSLSIPGLRVPLLASLALFGTLMSFHALNRRLSYLALKIAHLESSIDILRDFNREILQFLSLKS